MIKVYFLPRKESKTRYSRQANLSQSDGRDELVPRVHGSRKVIQYNRPAFLPKPKGGNHKSLQPSNSAMND